MRLMGSLFIQVVFSERRAGFSATDALKLDGLGNHSSLPLPSLPHSVSTLLDYDNPARAILNSMRESRCCKKGATAAMPEQSWVLDAPSKPRDAHPQMSGCAPQL